MRVVDIELTEALCYDNSVPGGRDSRQLGGTAAVPHQRLNQETNEMELTSDERKLLAIVREKPELMAFALRLASEFADKSPSSDPQPHDKPLTA